MTTRSAEPPGVREAERCLAAGMDDYLAKPAGVAQLAATLARWLDRANPDTTASMPVDAPHAAATSAEPAESAAPALDPDVLRSLLGNDTDGMRAVLDDFMHSLAQDLDALAHAQSHQDLPAITRQAHRIRGAALSVGALALSQAAARLETAARAARRWPEFDPALAQLQPVVAMLRRSADGFAATPPRT